MEAKKDYQNLLQELDPLLEKYFLYQMDSLAKRMLTIRE
jgi:hypothetical protein